VQDGSSGGDIIGAGNHARRLFFTHALESTDQLDRDRCCCGTPVTGTWQRTTSGGRRPEDEGQGAAAKGRRPVDGGQRAGSGQRAAARGRAAAKGRAAKGRRGPEGGRRNTAGGAEKQGDAKSVEGDLARAQVLEVGDGLEQVSQDYARAASTRSTSQNKPTNK
jgi:hypothetical protein